MRVLFAGGGTGGHVYPALAIAKSIKEKYSNAKILFVGTRKGLEYKIVPAAGLDFRTIEVEGWQRKISWQALRAGLKAVQGGTQALNIIRKFNPEIVIGTGGYVCGPVVLAARFLNIPTIIHEQNALPGLTNKTLGRIVNKIMITFPDSQKYFSDSEKVILTGLPVREEILSLTKEEGLNFFQFKENKKTLLISGGSRGARSINRAMLGFYKKLKPEDNIQIIHITGEQGYDDTLGILAKEGIETEKNGNIILKPYLYNMEFALAAADLCVGRAGATFIAEITARGLASVLIPYPYAAENHQEYNAKSLVARDAAVMILEKELSEDLLADKIFSLLNDKDKLKKLASNSRQAGNPDSLKKILEVIDKNKK